MDVVLVYIIIFCFGAVIGSFLNVCICRLPQEESVVSPGSHCPYCKNIIKWYDNIPFFSYLNLRGKCRYCQKKISPRYFIIEFLNAFLYVVIFKYFYVHSFLLVLAYFIFASLLIVTTFIDFEHFIIPDSVSLGGAMAGLLMSLICPKLVQETSSLIAFSHSFLGGIICGGVLFIVAISASYIVKKEAMGMGDVKLLTMIGTFLGWKLGLFTILLASFLGSLVGITLIIAKGFAWQSKIPFGPYLSVGALISLFFGEKMINFYFYLLMKYSL